MSITCDICGMWSTGTGIGHRDICLSCFHLNFAGNPLEGGTEVDVPVPVPASPPARDVLQAFLCHDTQLPPRQVQAMARLAARWRQDLED